jgi:hypothetical protein
MDHSIERDAFGQDSFWEQLRQVFRSRAGADRIPRVAPCESKFEERC